MRVLILGIHKKIEGLTSGSRKGEKTQLVQEKEVLEIKDRAECSSFIVAKEICFEGPVAHGGDSGTVGYHLLASRLTITTFEENDEIFFTLSGFFLEQNQNN